jgi:hypothetical protein
MRKLKLQIQTSLDGFVAGPNGEGDWLFLAGKNEHEALQQIIDFNVELAGSSDTLLIGRKWLLQVSLSTGKTWPTTYRIIRGIRWRS